jgi:hypothetical protein
MFIYINIYVYIYIYMCVCVCVCVCVVIFRVLKAARMKFRVFSDVAPCSHVKVDRRFRGAYFLHHHCPDEGGSTHL